MKQILLLLSAIMTALTGVVGGGRAQARAEVAGAGLAVVAEVARAAVRIARRPAGQTVVRIARLASFALAPPEPIWAGRRRI